jgi:hypothetical protein
MRSRKQLVLVALLVVVSGFVSVLLTRKQTADPDPDWGWC